MLGRSKNSFVDGGDVDQYLKKAKRVVILGAPAFRENVKEEDLYIVWFSKTLKNWKALLSTDLESGHYFEVTYDGEKKQTYVDHYIKRSNKTVADSQLTFLSLSDNKPNN